VSHQSINKKAEKEAIKIDKHDVDKSKKYLHQEFITHISGRNLIHVDVPVYLNIGDLLIDKGTEVLIEKCNGSLIDRFSIYDQKRLLKSTLDKSTVILLQGGGNFGDLYKSHQELRLQVVKNFPDNKIIILPQSVWYKNDSNCIKEAATFEQHKNLTIYVRDTYSEDYLKKRINSEKIKMAPDLATILDVPFNKDASHQDKTLLFRRRDKESTEVNRGTSGRSFDWEDIIDAKEKKSVRKHRKLMESDYSFLNRLGHRMQKKLRDKLILRAISFFNNYSEIDSDRLHGTLLATILGIPTIRRDNNYSKIKKYFDTWY